MTRAQTSRPGFGLARFSLGLTLIVISMFAIACGPSIDEEFPPGDPTMVDEPGDNPVLGSDGPGAAAIAETDTTNYGLLALIAVLLIAAGVLLVKVEAWERRRSGED